MAQQVQCCEKQMLMCLGSKYCWLADSCLHTSFRKMVLQTVSYLLCWQCCTLPLQAVCLSLQQSQHSQEQQGLGTG